MEKKSTGYKNPPRETQWKPGQSGNLKGRPRKKSPSMDELYVEFAEKTIPVNGEAMTCRKAVVAKQWMMAIKGDKKAMAEVIARCERMTQYQAPSMHDKAENGMIDRAFKRYLKNYLSPDLMEKVAAELPKD